MNTDTSNAEQQERGRCSALLAAIGDIDEAWGEMLKFGNHEGDCGFDGKCEKCGRALGVCKKHGEHMALRLNGMTAALNRARALAANDPKLSDGGAWRGACPTVERTETPQM